MIKCTQTVAYDAYKASGQLAALDMSDCPPEALARTLESAAANLEQGAVTMRTLCESLWIALLTLGRRSSLPPLELAGRLEVNEFGWLHIRLETLLPHCRFEPPLWLTDTITRLLNQYEGRRGKLPVLERALLVMEELCDVDSRRVYDADNKGWKAVSNALKGRLVADDDQFSLSVCLLARRSPAKEYHIYVLPLQDTEDFFFMRNNDYPFAVRISRFALGATMWTQPPTFPKNAAW